MHTYVVHLQIIFKLQRDIFLCPSVKRRSQLDQMYIKHAYYKLEMHILIYIIDVML